VALCLYTILPSPIVYGIYCNNGGSEGTLYCAIVWAMTGRGEVPKQRVCVQRTVLILAQKFRQNNILYRLKWHTAQLSRIKAQKVGG